MTVLESNAKSAASIPQQSTIGTADYRRICALVRQHFGIHLTDRKRTLVASRLRKLVTEAECSSISEYCERYLKDPSLDVLSALADQITTNHTFFYRESQHFGYFLDHVLPDLAGRPDISRSRDLRVWCAAASTGDEAYMLAMLEREFFGSDYGSWNAGVLATDISAATLNIAREGAYDAERLRTLPPSLRNKYFSQLADGRYQVIPELKKDVLFRRFNLMTKSPPFRKRFHVIFCRNVMIYFDQAQREEVVERLYSWTEPGGYLFIGFSETLGGGATKYKYVAPAVYRRP